MLRDAEWLIPVTDDPARRRAVIAEHWKTVSADRLPLDEQEFWAETAARRVAPTDLPRLAETLAKVGESTRIRFFATCAAECKHRSLRRIALADLAAHRPDINTIDRMVRLIEAAPTWASDRAQGARVLLLAIAAGSLPGSQSQRLTWTWKLARASRETQYRAATAASPAIRDLLRTLASSRGEEHHVRARLLVASLRQAELPVAAAALAAALTHDAIAARTIEHGARRARRRRRGAGRRVRLEPARAEGRSAGQGAPPAQEAQGPPGGAAAARGRRQDRRGQAGTRRQRRRPRRPARTRRHRAPTARPPASAAAAAGAARARARRVRPGAHANGAAAASRAPTATRGSGRTRARAGQEAHAAQEARAGPDGRDAGR